MEKLKIVVPKGRIYDNVADLLISAGIYFKTTDEPNQCV